jgi:hypothetical protein
MLEKFRYQYNIDRIALIDDLYERLNGDVPKEVLMELVCDYESLILDFLTTDPAIETEWYIPNVLKIYNQTYRTKRKTSKQKETLAKRGLPMGRKELYVRMKQEKAMLRLFLQQKLNDFFVG